MYQRSVSQFERQQRRLELEHHELLSRVSRLTDEVDEFTSILRRSVRSLECYVRSSWRSAWESRNSACYSQCSFLWHSLGALGASRCPDPWTLRHLHILGRHPSSVGDSVRSTSAGTGLTS